MKLWLLVVFIFFVVFENLFFENIIEKAYALLNSKNIYIALYYSLVTLIGFLSISIFFFVRNRILFSLFSLLLIFTYSIELVYKSINKVGFSLNDLTVAIAEVDAFAVDALKTYAFAFEKAAIVLVFFIVLMLFFRSIVHKNSYYISFKWVVSFFMIALMLSYSVLYKTTGATQTRPTTLKVSNLIAYYTFNRLYYGKRELLKAKPIAEASYKNIIFIVDESIGGKYLSINGYKKETTPYLKSIEKKFVNLGLASSTANCSNSSNILLMSGLQLNELPDKENNSLKKPTIFQFAKNAGYQTYYLSGQSINNRLQNYMSKYDLMYIDDFSQPKEEFRHKNMPEENIILETKKALDVSEKNFIYIVKHGAHFQWEESYPEHEKYFLPTLSSADALSLDKKDKAINSYLNAVRYNVDLFFKYFLEEIEFSKREDTLIIYTSDHGQSILEEGRVATHCDSTNPPLSQGVVPLLLFSSKSSDLINKFDFQKNIYSHYEIVPTIEKLMGYKVRAKTFFDMTLENYEQKFVSGDIFGRTILQINNLN